MRLAGATERFDGLAGVGPFTMTPGSNGSSLRSTFTWEEPHGTTRFTRTEMGGAGLPPPFQSDSHQLATAQPTSRPISATTWPLEELTEPRAATVSVVELADTICPLIWA